MQCIKCNKEYKKKIKVKHRYCKPCWAKQCRYYWSKNKEKYALRTKLWSHKTGRARPIDQVTEHKHKKGRQAEIKVANYLKNWGFEVELGNGKLGPDIVVIDPLSGKKETIEVKSVTKSSYTKNYSIDCVYPNRKKDDYIAFPLPNDDIFIESMKKHLSKCPPSGHRTVSEIIWPLL